jgi:hypothetical protein
MKKVIGVGVGVGDDGGNDDDGDDEYVYDVKLLIVF